MSREDVEESLQPVWHSWKRVGPTREHYVEPGEDWPTSSAVCTQCREFRQDVAVSLLEGTFQLPPEVWPGKCNLGGRGPADTDWVSMATDPPPMGRIGRGLLRSVGNAMIWAFIAWVVVAALNPGDYPVWLWIPAMTVFGLGTGIYSSMTEGPSKKRPKRKG